MRTTSTLLAMMFTGVLGMQAAVANDSAHKPIDVLLQQTVTTTDGTELAATVWKPDADDKRYTAVLVVTPYVSDEAQARGRIYVDRGYALVSLDRRSRGASDGPHEVLTDVGPDACAAIAWIKQQPWSDGRVAMRGGSYRGMSQWMTARACPDELETIMPTASVYPGHSDFPLGPGLVSYKYTARWLSFVAGPTRNINLFSDEAYWQERALTSYRQHLPFHQYDAFVGYPSPIFQKWVETLSEPAQWDSYTIPADAYAAMDMPILTITGHYDGDQLGALGYYRQHQASAQRKPKRDHHLVLGPWDHAGTRVPRQRLSESVEFGANAAFDMDQFNLDWLDWTLGRGPKPELLTKGRVVYYVGGANEWRYADDLDAVAAETHSLFLSAAPDEAADVFRSGHLLGEPVSSDEPHTFINDPLDTSPADLTEENWGTLANGNFRKDWAAHMPETLVFHSSPLPDEQVMAGQMKLTLYLEMDAPDTDIFATVAAVFPDGEILHLGASVVRARFRNGLEPELVEPGVVEPYVFDTFFWNAWALPAGARIRLTVGPFNDPMYQKNYNSGGKLGFETADDARVATIKLHHNSEYPSVLEIPLAE
ncbi:MAG: CocE/NonD family hydrolase [Pseudomonadota bacterium]